MTMNDPIADMFNRINNALTQNAQLVTLPSSKVKLAICEVFKREGFIENFELVEKPVQNDIKIVLKYGPDGERVINMLKRVSTPGRRIYRSIKEIRPVLRGMGIAVVSTSHGVFSDRECRGKGIGGEVICQVW